MYVAHVQGSGRSEWLFACARTNISLSSCSEVGTKWVLAQKVQKKNSYYIFLCMFPTAGMLSWCEDNEVLALKNINEKISKHGKKETDMLIELFGYEEKLASFK